MCPNSSYNGDRLCHFVNHNRQNQFGYSLVSETRITVILISIFLFFSFDLRGQIPDYTVFWKKSDFTGNESVFDAISPQNDGTYLVCGRINRAGKNNGYIAEMNEEGAVISDYEIVLPLSSSYPQLSGGTAYATLVGAYKTPNGNILAFGKIMNGSAPDEYKTFGDFLREAVWVIIIDAASKAITTQRLDPGMITSGVIPYSDNQFLVFGYDYTGIENEISLLRIYDQDGTMVYDNYRGAGAARIKIREIMDLTRLKNGDLFADSPARGHILDGMVLNIKKAFFTGTEVPCIENTVPPTGTYKHNWFLMAPKIDGGAWGSTDLVLDPNTGQDYGLVMVEYAPNTSVKECKVLIPVNQVRNKSHRRIISETRDKNSYLGILYENLKRSLFQIKDLPGGFEIHEGKPFPFTAVNLLASTKSGYFAIGHTNETPIRAIIMKFGFCSSFKIEGVEDIFEGYSNQVSIHKSILFKGADVHSLHDIKYDLKATVRNGKVNGKQSGDVLENLVDKSVWDFSDGSGKVLEFVRNFQLDPNQNSAEIEYRLIVKNGGCVKDTTFMVSFARPSQTVFSDDIWFFGTNEAGDKTSRGIRFVESNGTKHAEAYSGISKINSLENILAVNDPCGNSLFYAHAGKMYNGKHELMEGGSFNGYKHVADGMATAYIGGNRYIFFSVADLGAAKGELYYSVIDMAANNGFGKMEEKGKVLGNTVSRSIELIPKVGTYNQYWLIYHDVTEQKIKVREINGEDSNPIGKVVGSVTFSHFAQAYRMKTNSQYSKIVYVIADSPSHKFYMFSFNPSSGQLTLDYERMHVGELYSAEFSPSGTYLYTIALYNDKVRQYNVKTGNLLDSLLFNPIATANPKGADIKLGVDGKIYIMRWDGQYVAVINRPNLPLAQSELTKDGFLLKMGGNGYCFSTGITPSWINPPLAVKPLAISDGVNTFKELPISIQPVSNDKGDALYLLNAEFQDKADNTKGNFSIQGNTLIFIPKSDYIFSPNESITLNYTVKSTNALQLCDRGVIQITICSLPEINLLDSCSFNPKLQFDEYVEGLDIQWQISNDGANWQNIVGANTNTHSIVQEGYYRVKLSTMINAEMKLVHTPSRFFKVEIKKLQNQKWYRVSKQ